jgi:anti-sigma regulatory factor (Ser/Thr protein kinase)
MRMLTIQKRNGSIRCTISSDMSSVELFSRILKDMLVYAHIPVANEVTLVARELLANAVIHGNGLDQRKKASFSLEELCGAGFHVTVKDEGQGFDFANLGSHPKIGEHHSRKRGFVIIRNCSRRIVFKDNGASVSVFLGLGEEDWDTSERRDVAEKREIVQVFGAL